MADIYIPAFCGKDLCEHAYLRKTNAFEYILKDIHERFLNNDAGTDDDSTDDLSDNTYINLAESMTDLLEVSNTTYNIKLLDRSEESKRITPEWTGCATTCLLNKP